jgi:DDE family transposase/Homeodomain-like domain-containing protein
VAIVADRNRPRKHVERARIVLASADRGSAQQVAQSIGVSRPTVWRWQQRFAGTGVEGLRRDKSDLERCAPRPGNVHSADGWRGVLEPVVSGYRGKGTRFYFRGDAALANPEVYEFLEAEGMGYVIRLPVNRVLQDMIGHLLKSPSGSRRIEVRRSYASVMSLK